jgi:hypothetical protein
MLESGNETRFRGAYLMRADMTMGASNRVIAFNCKLNDLLLVQAVVDPAGRISWSQRFCGQFFRQINSEFIETAKQPSSIHYTFP